MPDDITLERGRPLTDAELLRRADWIRLQTIDLIAQAGGGRVESYPHDLTNQTKKMSSSFLYNGTRTMYEREGFTYDRPKGQGNCVMVREVAPSTRDPAPRRHYESLGFSTIARTCTLSWDLVAGSCD